MLSPIGGTLGQNELCIAYSAAFQKYLHRLYFNRLYFKLTKDNPYLTLVRELLNVFCEFFFFWIEDGQVDADVSSDRLNMIWV